MQWVSVSEINFCHNSLWSLSLCPTSVWIDLFSFYVIQNELITTKCDESKEDSGKHSGENEASRMVDEGRKEEGRVRTEWRFVPGFSESIRRNKWRKGGRRVVDWLGRIYCSVLLIFIGLMLPTSGPHPLEPHRHLDSVHPRIAEAHSWQTMAPI